MKDKLIAMVAQRANLSEDVAEKAVDAVLDFFKENPGKVTELLGNVTESGPASGLGKLFGR